MNPSMNPSGAKAFYLSAAPLSMSSGTSELAQFGNSDPGLSTMNGKVIKQRGTNAIARGRHAASSRGQVYAAKHLRAILDSTTDGYAHWSIPSGDLDFGDRWLSLLGYSRSSLSRHQRSPKRLMHPEDLAVFESQIHALLVGETSMLHCELRFRTKAGDYRWFELRGRAVRTDRRGTPTEIAATVCDIQARKQNPYDLVQSHEPLVATLNAAEDCIFVVDPVKFGLVLFNKAFDDLVFRSRGVHLRPG